jgi:hypothetical protein
VTKRLADAGQVIGIYLIGHLIASDVDYVSIMDLRSMLPNGLAISSKAEDGARPNQGVASTQILGVALRDCWSTGLIS